QIGVAADAAPGFVHCPHIAAGAESTVAGAAHDNGMHQPVVFPGAQSRIEAPVIIEGQRVERLRPVDRNRGKAVLAAKQDLGSSHQQDIVITSRRSVRSKYATAAEATSTAVVALSGQALNSPDFGGRALIDLGEDRIEAPQAAKPGTQRDLG